MKTESTTTAKHTPVVDLDERFTVKTSPCGCLIRSARENGQGELWISYCRLHGTAPELLDALKAMMPEGWGDDGMMDHMPGIKQARLAIKKAEGAQ